MIISASRRTDIPAFYSDWLFHRLAAGFVDTINPFNRKQVSRVSLAPEDVDAIVFWTKNAAPMLPRLGELSAYKYYFQFTLTPYGKDAEPGLPEKAEVVRAFQELSRRLGRARVVWRYDPIIYSEKYDLAYHREAFKRLLEELAPYTDTCVVSFLDLYRKTERNTRTLSLKPIDQAFMEEIAGAFAEEARGSGVALQSCSETLDLDALGIRHGACIDKERLELVIGGQIDIKKDPTQRQECGCMKSVDIGAYDTCRHLCRYCYANTSAALAEACHRAHDPRSTLLSGHLLGDEKITARKIEHVKLKPSPTTEQLTLF